MKPVNTNNLVNISNSLLNHYGISPKHATLGLLDDALKKDYKHVVLLLMDGLGTDALKQHAPNSFLMSHKVSDINSVFPATTTAATTSVLSGLYPVEHGWLGWDLYMPPIDQTVTMFLNVVKDTNKVVSASSMAHQLFGYISILEQINSEQVKAYAITPYFGLTYEEQDLDGLFNLIKKQCQKDEKNFIYAYTNQPDALMHDKGIHHPSVTRVIHKLDTLTKQLAQVLNDTLMIVIADHGHMNVKEIICLNHYPELVAMLERETSIEARAVNFFVKASCHEAFKNRFNALFKDDFLLLDRQTITQNNWFGLGIAHPLFDSCLGDFMAIAIGTKAIIDQPLAYNIIGMHAGLTHEETQVPLIFIPCQ